MIEHLQLDPKEMARNEDIMREGNLALKQNFDLVKAKMRGRYSRRTFRQELFAVMNSSPAVIRGITISPDSIAKIMAVKAIETAVVQTFSKLVQDRARRYSRRDHGTYLEKSDFLSYGYTGLLEAIYYYTKEVETKGVVKKIKFITYADWCICRHIRNAVNRKKSNYPWTSNMRKLYERYEKAKREFNGPTNFQELVDYLGFTPEEQNMLHSALTAFQGERGLSKPGNDDYWEDSKGFDYTCLATENTHFRKAEMLEIDEKEYIDDLWVSYLEAETVENYISGHYGWKEKLAKKYNISRQAPFETLRRFRQRLEAESTIRKFETAFASGKRPYVYDYIGDPPEGNKEKLGRWTKLRESLEEIEKRWKGRETS